ncbi:hypothetical protein [Chitinophaga rhizophila]|uniref:PsbP C-terminal domain-containing protein n=1 Tax=Chitinophaga rhizophila TaxID=2866212 RepID=A0ABS7GD88_9BACT|nr:hypothetical protein [Chitinophaga rhizophila]MBW8685245.1 hypothetical protein [Chitinophaga rhizophila]
MKYLLLALACCLAGFSTFAQENMIYGKRHLITVETPTDWVQMQHAQLPYMIVPADTKSQPAAYMYVFGMDYPTSPDVEAWMKSNTEALEKAVKGATIKPLDVTLDNIRPEGYTTGRYKAVLYIYPNGKKEVLLAIECKHTIVTIVCSVTDGTLFEQYLPAFTAAAGSLQISEAEITTVEEN